MTRADIYREVAAELRAMGEHGSEHAALLVEQLADEQEERYHELRRPSDS